MVLAAAVIGLLLLGTLPFGVDTVSVTSGGVWGLIISIAISGLLVGVALLKGRIWLGVLGLLVPLVALIGALRLAKPQSPWARWRYPAEFAEDHPYGGTCSAPRRALGAAQTHHLRRDRRAAERRRAAG